MQHRKIFCAVCNKIVPALKKKGRDCYPNHSHLFKLYFWSCPYCSNFVGCHPDSNKPLGVIVNSDIKKLRKDIHNILDPLWLFKGYKRTNIYKYLSEQLGYEYHTANITTIEEAIKVYNLICALY